MTLSVGPTSSPKSYQAGNCDSEAVVGICGEIRRLCVVPISSEDLEKKVRVALMPIARFSTSNHDFSSGFDLSGDRLNNFCAHFHASFSRLMSALGLSFEKPTALQQIVSDISRAILGIEGILGPEAVPESLPILRDALGKMIRDAVLIVDERFLFIQK